MQRLPGLLIATARHRIKRAVLQRVAAHDLSPQQFWMMVAIREQPGISQVDIVSRTRADAPSVSRALSALVDRGLVRTGPDPRDRRRTLAQLTPAGQRLARDLLPIARELRERMVAGMSATAVASLCAALQKIIDNLDALEARGQERERA